MIGGYVLAKPFGYCSGVQKYIHKVLFLFSVID